MRLIWKGMDRGKVGALGPVQLGSASAASYFDMREPVHYRAVIEELPIRGPGKKPLYRYAIHSVDDGELVYEGHACDAAEADATAQAHIRFLQEKAVRLDRSAA